MKKLFIILLVTIGLVSSVSAKSTKKKQESPEIKLLQFQWCNPATNGWKSSWAWQLKEVYENIDSDLIPLISKMDVYKNITSLESFYYLFKEFTTGEWYLAETHFSDEYNTITITWKRVKIVSREDIEN